MSLKIFSDQKPSEAAVKTLFASCGGTPVQECGHCGRIHFNGSGEFMDEGELEDLERKQQENPNEYISHESVRYAVLLNKYFVYDCPCNFITYFFDKVVWTERSRILKFLDHQSKENLETAQEDRTEFDRVSDSVKRAEHMHDEPQRR